ncbi:chromate resistance protein ChrB domain-containing protein [Pollutibacter soli]|uniref:chromate resistance protein ChrB domain-containing protein n=1 Tax=Pollutibacter soli TaxID=3034157 RepID=UPI0030135344
MKWITREKPKIDRIACPWLIKRFVDDTAEFIFCAPGEVITQSIKLKAIPFDVPGVEYTHYNDKCTFDFIISKHKIADPALKILAPIVRGADTDKHNLASQSSGLWAISAGLAYNIKDDYELLKQGMIVYDGLYSWAKYLIKEKHTQNPVDSIFLDVYKTYISKKQKGKKTPEWVGELKAIIQDQIDTNLSLTGISKELELNPSYLSREFSRYFDDLSFGEYIRKLRIDKAKELIQKDKYSLTEIAYLTGFSDQSHFTRVFKQVTGKNPSQFKKQWMMGLSV